MPGRNSSYPDRYNYGSVNKDEQPKKLAMIFTF